MADGRLSRPVAAEIKVDSRPKNRTSIRAVLRGRGKLENGEPPSEGSAEPATLLFTDEKPLMEVARRILKAVNQVYHPERMKKSALPQAIGIPAARVNAILNPGPEGATRFSLEEIGKVVAFARRFANGLRDRTFRNHIVDYCNELAERIHNRLELGGLRPTETAFVANLQLDDHRQQLFSDRYAGVYALIRLDRERHVLISRMDVHPREARLCRFATDSPSSGLSEPAVEGYIFSVGDEIQSIGRPKEASALRTAILRPCGRPGSAKAADMIGLRLGISEYDGGPFAYRIYCRRIAAPDQIGKPLPDWTLLFGARRHEASRDLETLMPDIGEILSLLQENDRGTPWGVRIPTGVEPEADKS